MPGRGRRRHRKAAAAGSSTTADLLARAVASMTLTHAPAPAHAAAAVTAPTSAPASSSSSAPPPATSSSTITTTGTTASATAQPAPTPADTITQDQVAAIKATHGIGSAEAIMAFKNHTDQLAASGQLNEAITVLQAALKEAMTTPHVARGFACDYSYCLALQLEAAGRHREAVKHLKWVSNCASQDLGHHSRQTMAYQLELCHCLMMLGEFKEMLLYATQVYEASSQSQPVPAAHYQRSVLCYLQACNGADTPAPAPVCAAAEQLLQQYKRTGGQLTLGALTLGSALLGQYEQDSQHHQAALKILPDVVAAAKHVYGDGSPEHLRMLTRRAFITQKYGKKYAQAISMMHHVVHTHATQRGHSHRATIAAAITLGEAYAVANKYEDAIKVFQEVWATARAQLSVGDELALRLYVGYRDVLLLTGKKEEATVMEQQARDWGITMARVLAWCAKQMVRVRAAD